MISQKKPTVSVIIPTYNRAKYVTKAIDSVLTQTYDDYEIIVIDDGSTDNTKEVLRPYSKRIRYLYQKRAGVSTSRNYGIRQARGAWIALLDSDDEWLPEKVATQMQEVVKNPFIIAHFTNLSFRMPNKEEINLFELRGNLRRNQHSWIVERPLVEELKYQFCFSSNYLGKRSTLFDVGLFDQRLTLHEDLDLFFRLALAGPWGVSDKVLVHMFRREETNADLSRQHKDNPIHSCESLVNIYGKLRSNDNLQPQEKCLVSKHMSRARFNLGMKQFKAGYTQQANANFRQSFFDNPSLKSFAKYLLTGPFTGLGAAIIELKASMSKKGFRRSDL
ncbi:MAG: glycosyltransferase family A protein [Planctomycetota bacterium]